MSSSDKFRPVIDGVNLLFAELSALEAAGPHIRIVHRSRRRGHYCVPGEEVLAICLVHRGREHQLRLSPALLVLADYLARYSRYAQSATQIVTGLHSSYFHTGDASNADARKYRFSRSAINVYVVRLHRAVEIALAKAGLPIEAREVLIVKESVSNHVLYRWKAIIEVVHVGW